MRAKISPAAYAILRGNIARQMNAEAQGKTAGRVSVRYRPGLRTEPWIPHLAFEFVMLSPEPLNTVALCGKFREVGVKILPNDLIRILIAMVDDSNYVTDDHRREAFVIMNESILTRVMIRRDTWRLFVAKQGTPEAVKETVPPPRLLELEEAHTKRQVRIKERKAGEKKFGALHRKAEKLRKKQRNAGVDADYISPSIHALLVEHGKLINAGEIKPFIHTGAGQFIPEQKFIAEVVYQLLRQKPASYCVELYYKLLELDGPSIAEVKFLNALCMVKYDTSPPTPVFTKLRKLTPFDKITIIPPPSSHEEEEYLSNKRQLEDERIRREEEERAAKGTLADRRTKAHLEFIDKLEEAQKKADADGTTVVVPVIPVGLRRWKPEELRVMNPAKLRELVTKRA